MRYPPKSISRRGLALLREYEYEAALRIHRSASLQELLTGCRMLRQTYSPAAHVKN
jgi:hypothetical protein